jgi:hypothetical protein
MFPYHKWYKNGWLCEKKDSEFKSKVIRPMYEELSEKLA